MDQIAKVLPFCQVLESHYRH